MGTVQERARILIESLSDEDAEILVRLAERLAEWEATQELLKDKEMVASINRGLKDLERGDSLSLEELRKSVSS
jgi:hypothetical protein